MLPEQHIEELRLELREAIDPVERREIETERSWRAPTGRLSSLSSKTSSRPSRFSEEAPLQPRHCILRPQGFRQTSPSSLTLTC